MTEIAFCYFYHSCFSKSHAHVSSVVGGVVLSWEPRPLNGCQFQQYFGMFGSCCSQVSMGSVVSAASVVKYCYQQVVDGDRKPIFRAPAPLSHTESPCPHAETEGVHHQQVCSNTSGHPGCVLPRVCSCKLENR